ncbi:hypothetical protein BD310DRAFT_945141 [Dichomitus squalens]|uniref:Secreted protein n=1 Tax=Dichomitus squalens TaxID=114155 RepID=A0A4Q9Q966_9APHY|nr:hypothetical protein BD310DRAFT_945141 [Dichomitus squalens]
MWPSGIYILSPVLIMTPSLCDLSIVLSFPLIQDCLPHVAEAILREPLRASRTEVCSFCVANTGASTRPRFAASRPDPLTAVHS